MGDSAPFSPHNLRRVAVTGANGLIGARVADAFVAHPNWADTIRLCRKPPANDSRFRQSPELTPPGNWQDALAGVDTVVHCAARAHVLAETGDAEAIAARFHAINCDGAVAVARAALALGVRHFAFLSSAGVVAEEAAQRPAREHTHYSPLSAYAVAKVAAEKKLIELFEDTPTKLVILRPPLVVARNAPGNMHRLESMSRLLMLNPFTGIANKRSVIGCTNLAQAIVVACSLPGEKSEILHPKEPLSFTTAELIDVIRQANGSRCRSLPLPGRLVSTLMSSLGQSRLYRKMFENFELDDENTRSLLGHYHIRSLSDELSSKETFE